ncbi:hypothetical protein EG68_12071 [Paragonimus skrjabini miyazakii]|uniref:N-acetylgalactosaminide beta-1,3-galactosyltransferase n=1 Tax=Paragonimus skrjabini miyazakii TaxID=59628 RepID=A0A8S9YD29_9TREM|nr:hypothetical protein EG68_12071 [Paragonimus skrjabini miyazakii]
MRRNLISVILGAIFAIAILHILKRDRFALKELVLSLVNPLGRNTISRNGCQPRVFCYVNTFSLQYDVKAIHAQNTWVRKCTSYTFLGAKPHPRLRTLGSRVNFFESKQRLWQKLRATMKFLYEIADEYDFFFKADDDTYVIMKNLHKLLEKMDPEEAFMTGREYGLIYKLTLLDIQWNKTYNVHFFHGGGGYVISSAAMKRLVEKALDKNPHCPRTNGQLEDAKTSESNV